MIDGRQGLRHPIQQRVYERVRRLELEAGVEPSNYERGDREAARPLTVETIETSVAR